MSRFVGILIAGTHQRGLRICLWLVAFVVLLFGSFFLLRYL
mgnify:CR=1 FL=1